jgi:hypothetical protein
MNFLNEVPQDWTKPELTELRDLLVLAYRRPSAAEQLADRVGIVPGTFPHFDNMRTTWTELVKVLGDQGKLQVAVELAAADPLAGAYQPRFAEMLGPTPAVATAQPVNPAGDRWKGDEQLPAVAAQFYPERLMERRTRLMRVELAQGITTAARSIAKLSLRFGNKPAHATGFLISDTQILTNHHNVLHPEFGGVTAVIAEFDYQQDPPAKPLIRKGLIESILGNAEHDWAVITLSSKVNRPALRLGTAFDVGVDDAVVIIQHPMGSFKQFALEPLAVRFVDDKLVQYVADTQQGSSGSPVFNSRMEIIALHHGEAEATVPVDGVDQVVWRNEGIHYSQLTTGLTQHEIAFEVNV